MDHENYICKIIIIKNILEISEILFISNMLTKIEKKKNGVFSLLLMLMHLRFGGRPF